LLDAPRVVVHQQPPAAREELTEVIAVDALLAYVGGILMSVRTASGRRRRSASSTLS
jgi:hypothetical protein